jgi:hypothetical protein
MINYDTLFRANLPAAAVKYNGFPKYNFVGGHNDAASVPVDDIVAAASKVLKREGATLATYGLQSGPQGYRALREFLVKKLARSAGITSSSRGARSRDSSSSTRCCSKRVTRSLSRRRAMVASCPVCGGSVSIWFRRRSTIRASISRRSGASSPT